MTFEDELSESIARWQAEGAPPEEIAAGIALFHRARGREPPPPITGTIALTERSDSLRRS